MPLIDIPLICPKCGSEHCRVLGTQRTGESVRAGCSYGCGYSGLRSEFSGMSEEEYTKKEKEIFNSLRSGGT